MARRPLARPGPTGECRQPGCRVVAAQGGHTMPTDSPTRLASPRRVQELDRLGDTIADLAAHLDAATARLLDLIRDFDARGGWNSGFPSCPPWLSWRGGPHHGGAPERGACPPTPGRPRA